MKPIDRIAPADAMAHALSDGDSEGADRGAREFEAAVSEGWPVSPEGAGSMPLRRDHKPADGRTSDDHAHDDEHR